jgi:hypothetical protein
MRGSTNPWTSRLACPNNPPRPGKTSPVGDLASTRKPVLPNHHRGPSGRVGNLTAPTRGEHRSRPAFLSRRALLRSGAHLRRNPPTALRGNLIHLKHLGRTGLTGPSPTGSTVPRRQRPLPVAVTGRRRPASRSVRRSHSGGSYRPTRRLGRSPRTGTRPQGGRAMRGSPQTSSQSRRRTGTPRHRTRRGRVSPRSPGGQQRDRPVDQRPDPPVLQRPGRPAILRADQSRRNGGRHGPSGKRRPSGARPSAEVPNPTRVRPVRVAVPVRGVRRVPSVQPVRPVRRALPRRRAVRARARTVLVPRIEPTPGIGPVPVSAPVPVTAPVPVSAVSARIALEPLTAPVPLTAQLALAPMSALVARIAAGRRTGAVPRTVLAVGPAPNGPVGAARARWVAHPTPTAASRRAGGPEADLGRTLAGLGRTLADLGRTLADLGRTLGRRGATSTGAGSPPRARRFGGRSVAGSSLGSLGTGPVVVAKEDFATSASARGSGAWMREAVDRRLGTGARDPMTGSCCRLRGNSRLRGRTRSRANASCSSGRRSGSGRFGGCQCRGLERARFAGLRRSATGNGTGRCCASSPWSW